MIVSVFENQSYSFTTLIKEKNNLIISVMMKMHLTKSKTHSGQKSSSVEKEGTLRSQENCRDTHLITKDQQLLHRDDIMCLLRPCLVSDFLSFLFKLFLFMCLSNLPAWSKCTTWVQRQQGPEEGVRASGTEVWMVVSYHIGAGNHIQVLCKMVLLTSAPTLQPPFLIWQA